MSYRHYNNPFIILLLLTVVSGAYNPETESTLDRQDSILRQTLFKLSNHFPSIFQYAIDILQFDDCIKTFIYGENKVNQLPQINFMSSSITVILSNPKTYPTPSLPSKYSYPCSIVLYLTSILNSTVKLIEEDWVSRIPGGTLHSFHFFVGNLPTRHFWELPFVRRLSNVLYLVPFDGADSDTKEGYSDTWLWTLIVPTRYVRNQRLLAKEITKTSLIKGTLKKLNPFRNMWKDLQGEHLLIGVPPQITEKFVTEYKEINKHRFLGVLVSEVSDMLNATPKLISNDIRYGNGARLPNGTWTSYIGKLMSDTIDITVPFTPFSYQYKILGMSKGVIFTPFKYFAPLPKKVDMTLKFLIEPFDEFIWIALFFCILGNVVVIYFLMRFSDQLSSQNFAARLYFVGAKIVDFVRVLIDQPIPDDVLTTTGYGSGGPRLIFLVWLLIMIVVGNLYKSAVISILVQPVYVNPPLTVPELVKSDFRINFLFYKAFQWDKRLPWVKDLKHPVNDYNMNFSGCLQSLLNGSNVCVFVQNYLYLFAPDHLVNELGRRQFLESKDSFYSTSSFFGISQLQPQLNDAMDRIAEVIAENGMEIYWVKIEFHQRSLITIHRKQKESPVNLLADSLVNTKLMLYPNLILITGLLVSLVCFMLELYRKCYVFLCSVFQRSSLPNYPNELKIHYIAVRSMTQDSTVCDCYSPSKEITLLSYLRD